MRVVKIKLVPRHLLEIYEVELMEIKTSKIFTMALSKKQLTKHYVKDFVHFL